MIPLDRTQYLELARYSRKRKFVIMCLLNYQRVLNKKTPL